MTGISELLEDHRLADLRERLDVVLRRVGAPSEPGIVDGALHRLHAAHGRALTSLPPAELYRAAHAALVQELRAEPASARAPDAVDPGAALRAAVRKLAPPRARAVTLYLLGHTVPEVAHLLGHEVAEAEQLVYRGLAEVRAALAGARP